MKTLLSINNYFYRRGGAETVFLEQNQLLQNHGWTIVPFSMRHSNNLPSKWDGYFVKEIELGKKYSLHEKIKIASKVVFSFEARRNLNRLIDTIQPDIAHAHNVYHHISPSIFGLLKKRGIPVVLTLHDLKIACPAYKMLTHDGICERCKNGDLWNLTKNRCIKNSFSLSAFIMVETYIQRLLGCYSNHVDQFIVPSKFYLEKLVEWGWPREKFSYIPNFVDVASNSPFASIAGTAFLFVGRLSSEKGVENFVRAVALSGVKGWIVGTGPEEQYLKKLTVQLQADIIFFGYRSGDDLLNLIRTARAVVLPSEWYENAPMSILEAYALEKPVIGAKIGGIPELIQEAKTGMLFESGNKVELARELQRFSEMSDNEILQMGKQGLEWVKKEYSAETYRSNLMNLYRKMGVDI